MSSLIVVFVFLVAGLSAPRAYAGPCSIDGDCKMKRVCREGACVPPGCGRDRDCPGDQICKTGACVEPVAADLGGEVPRSREAPAAPESPHAAKNACVADSDCGRHRYCIEGACGRKKKQPDLVPAVEAEKAPPPKPPAPIDWPTAIPPPPPVGGDAPSATSASSAPPAASAPPSGKPACTIDSECPRHRYCIEGQCARRSKTSRSPAAAAPASAAATPPSAAVGCGTDKDCPGSQVCNDGTCANPGSAAPPPAPALASGAAACGTDKDCPGEQVCNDGRCAGPRGAPRPAPPLAPPALAQPAVAQPGAKTAAPAVARSPAAPKAASCKADVECDGEDVCEDSVCVSPMASKSRVSAVSGLVRDAMLKIAWQRASSPQLLQRAEAEEYCKKLKLTGAGWRLPTIDELQSLASTGTPDHAASFEAVHEPLWTSSADAEKYWVATVSPLVKSLLLETGRARARCVR